MVAFLVNELLIVTTLHNDVLRVGHLILSYHEQLFLLSFYQAKWKVWSACWYCSGVIYEKNEMLLRSVYFI